MLVYEGLFYALGAVAAALVLAVVLSGRCWAPQWAVCSGSSPTVSPVAADFRLVLPAFALLGVLVPLASLPLPYAKRTIVERLRETDN